MAPRLFCSLAILRIFFLLRCKSALAGEDEVQYGQLSPALVSILKEVVETTDIVDFDYVKFKLPPVAPPEEKFFLFTRNGTIPIDYRYADDSFDGEGAHYVFDAQDIQVRIKRWQNLFEAMSKGNYNDLVDYNYRKMVVDSVFRMKGQLREMDKIVVFGSTEPWLESMLLALGVKRVITFEYNHLTYEHPSIETVRYSNMVEIFASRSQSCSFVYSAASANDNAIRQRQCDNNDDSVVTATVPFDVDAAFSIASFDHDGMGRYNEPVCADADLISMRLTKTMLKKDGLLFLSVPVGKDLLLWNTMRRYGRIRLPLLLSGWEVLHRHGWIEEKLLENEVNFPIYKPLFILKKL